MSIIRKIPVVILSGFLGSGKTTLLANWIRSQEFGGAQVIVNELGEVGLDHQLVSASGDGSLLLDNGCACCTVFEDLAETLERLFWRRLHREIPRFSWVLVETTGIADPAAIVAKLGLHQFISERYDISSVVSVVDATNSDITEFSEFRKQIKAASVVVISKTDIATPQQVSVIARQVRKETSAHLIHAQHGQLSIPRLLNYLDEVASGVGSTNSGNLYERIGHAADMDHEHSQEYSSAFFPITDSVDEWVLTQAIERLFSSHKRHLLRVKGLIKIDDYDQLKLLQFSPSGRVAISDTGSEVSAKTVTGLTLITYQVPASSMLDELDGYFGRPFLPTLVESESV